MAQSGLFKESGESDLVNDDFVELCVLIVRLESWVMMRRSLGILIWILLPCMAGSIGFGIASGFIKRQWAIHVESVPIVEFPARIDLGEHEEGEVVNAYFSITNRGKGELTIDQIRTSCSCLGLEKEVDGKFVRVESLRLKAKEAADLTLRISVRGPAGLSSWNRFWFHTNDVTCPEGMIEVFISRVKGGIKSTPVSIVFGNVCIGEKPRQVVNIFDSAPRSRKLNRVISSNPRRVTLRSLPLDTGSDKHEDSSLGTLLARVEILLSTKESGRIDESLHVYLDDDDQTFHAISVTGQISDIVESMPSTLVLPRSSNQSPLYSGNCLCRAIKGEPLTITIEFVPPNFKVVLIPIEGSPHMRLVRIEYLCPPRKESLSHLPHLSAVRLHAKVGNQNKRFEIPVIVRSERSL